MINKAIILIILLSIPTFLQMLRFGIYTMHDFHVFRQYEFNQCIQDGVFPCRWSANSGKGYGEPLFNYYGQFPYWIGQVFHNFGLSVIDSTKAVFILSLILSGVFMFLFARTYWGNTGGMVSSILYMYAPYRSVDVWVRGALPESLAFVFFPLLLLLLKKYFETKKTYLLILFSYSLAMLITTHNLSVLMFAPFLFLYWAYLAILHRDLRNLIGIVPAGLFALLLSSYYWLPVVLESHLVTLTDTTQGYYNYRIHFATLRELFISRYWGYGASLWARKFLSISIGQIHWIIPLITLPVMLVFSKRLSISKNKIIAFIIFFSLGLISLWLTHGKSVFIWSSLPFMKYIQFPWRFLSPAVFFLSLASGFIVHILPSRLSIVVASFAILVAIATNVEFFRPDIWRPINDHQLFSGLLWDESRSSALSDFWPKTAPKLPDQFASDSAIFLSGSGHTISYHRKSHSAALELEVTSSQASISPPIVYFPGWVVSESNKLLSATPSGDLGLVTTTLLSGSHTLNYQFTDTPPRKVGNIISLFSFLITPLWFFKRNIG